MNESQLVFDIAGSYPTYSKIWFLRTLHIILLALGDVPFYKIDFSPRCRLLCFLLIHFCYFKNGSRWPFSAFEQEGK